ncbi:hypothetical protein [Cellulomonas marina]|uniref:Fibronectin type-III domain-containing protein n=1 Tax=Cellulomonas marina TaxID=988821 RepID=A0A1I0XHN1_9CELL|nr:hypothetical protein [Cellulomonas marina]GIG30720.1 hypothetical protein Cma02nite_33200 [Cellulomonas marina]SFB00511.1 hypothetical protein SAMN05421867_10565 [Cellulomonas marina]
MDRIGEVRATDASSVAPSTTAGTWAEPTPDAVAATGSAVAGTPVAVSSPAAAAATAQDVHDETAPNAVEVAVQAAAAAYAAVRRRPGIDVSGSVSVGRTAATVGVHVTTHGMDTRAWVEWGRDGASARVGGVAVPGSAKAGSQGVRLSGLLPDTVYSFRVVASSRSGVAYGPVQAFRTQA